MGLDKFEIVLDTSYPPVAYAGQSVSGKIFISNSTPKKFRGIYIKAKGESEVRWKSKRRNSSNKVDGVMRYYGASTGPDSDVDLYRASEVYFDSKIPIFGGGVEETLQPGEYSYPFNCVLPSNLPSSFEGEFGYIRYSLKAVMDRPWKFDHEAKAVFTVICPLDLNDYPQLANAVLKETTKTFCCLCCAASPLNITLSVNTGGVVPGDSLEATLDIENTSSVDLNKISLKFIKSLTYIAKGGSCTKNVEVAVVKKLLGQLASGQSRTFEREVLQIPSLPPSNLIHCKIIDLDYFLEAHFTPSGCRPDVEVRVPVMLGTVPLQQNFAMYAQAPQSLPPRQKLEPSAPEIDAPPSYSDLAPPSYEESVFGARNVFDDSDHKDASGNKYFAPMYPVYYSS